jgi:hypothetical protein
MSKICGNLSWPGGTLITGGVVLPFDRRAFRKLMFVALVACPAAVTVCGPCLHELTGSSHRLSVAAKSSKPGDNAPPRDHNADNCLICHYVAQCQLPINLTCFAVVPLVFELATPEFPALPVSVTNTPSHPRAPPLALA